MTRFSQLWIFLIAIAAPANLIAAPPEEAQAIDRIPADALAVLLVEDGDLRVTEFRELLEQRGFWHTEVAAALRSNPKLMQAQIGLLGLAASAGADPWEAVAAVAGRQVAVGVSPGGGSGPRVIAAAASRNPELLRRLFDGVLALAGLNLNGQPDTNRSFKLGDAVIYAPAPKLFIGMIDDSLIVSNDRKWIEFAAAAKRGDPGGAGVSDVVRNARKRAPEDAWAIATADVAAVRKLVEDGKREIPTNISNPLAGFLFGGWWHSIRNSDSVVVALSTDAAGLQLDIDVAGGASVPETHRGFRPRAAERGSFRADSLAGAVGEIRISRDWASLFAERESLLTLPAAGQVVNFSNTLTTLLGGIDFLNDFLPRVEAPTRLIAVLQDFSDRSVLPTPRLPAFALVTPISHAAEGFEQRLLSGAQMAMSLLNFDQSKNGRPMLMLDMDKYRDQRIYFARYADDAGSAGMDMDPVMDPKEKAEDEPTFGPVQLNFAPAVTLFQDHFVVATSLDLCKRIMDAVSDDASPTANDTAGEDVFWLDGRGVVTALRQNQRELVTNRMLEASRGKTDAQREIDAFLELLANAERLTVTSTPTERGYHGRIALALRGGARP